MFSKTKKISLFFIVILTILLSNSLISNSHAQTVYEWIDLGDFEIGEEDFIGNHTEYIYLNVSSFVLETNTGFTFYEPSPYLNNNNDIAGVSVTGSSKVLSYFEFDDLPSTVIQVNNISLIEDVKSNPANADLLAYVRNPNGTWILCSTWTNIQTSWTNMTDDIMVEMGGSMSPNNYDDLRVKLDSSTTGGLVLSYDFITVRAGCLVGEVPENTETIIETSTPWFSALAVGSHYPEINTDTSNTGLFSCLFEIGSQHYSPIIQIIDNLNSNNVVNFTLYAIDASGSGGGTITARVFYTDGTFTTNTYEITGSWVQYDFSDLIVSSKIIYKIQIQPEDYLGSYIYIDDVSLLATVPLTDVVFYFDLTGSPLWINHVPSGFQNMGFGSYESVAYTAICTLYNDSVPYGNGTFTVSSSFSSATGEVLNGVLSFNIQARDVFVNNTKEVFRVDLVTDLITTTVSIDAYWYMIETEDVTDTEEQTTISLDMIFTLIPYLIVYGLCCGGGIYYLGFSGLIIGVNLAMIILVIIGQPIWLLPVTILLDIVLVVFRPSGEKPRGEINA